MFVGVRASVPAPHLLLPPIPFYPLLVREGGKERGKECKREIQREGEKEGGRAAEEIKRGSQGGEKPKYEERESEGGCKRGSAVKRGFCVRLDFFRNDWARVKGRVGSKIYVPSYNDKGEEEMSYMRVVQEERKEGEGRRGGGEEEAESSSDYRSHMYMWRVEESDEEEVEETEEEREEKRKEAEERTETRKEREKEAMEARIQGEGRGDWDYEPQEVREMGW
jgi:hypothetical protein